MNEYQKKALYESIMSKVAKTIKKSLNESSLINDENLSYVSNRLNALCSSILKPLKLMVKIGDATEDFEKSIFADPKLISNCAGYIIEQYVRGQFALIYGSNNVTPLYNKEENIHHDFTVTDNNIYNIEVKALLNGNSSNINLTDHQSENGSNYIFIFVNYKVTNNAIFINSFNIVPGDNADGDNFLKSLRKAQTQTNRYNNQDYRTIMAMCSHYMKRGQEDLSDSKMQGALSKYISTHADLFYDDDTNEYTANALNTSKDRNNSGLIYRALNKLFDNDIDMINKFISDCIN